MSITVKRPVPSAFFPLRPLRYEAFEVFPGREDREFTQYYPLQGQSDERYHGLTYAVKADAERATVYDG